MDKTSFVAALDEDRFSDIKLPELDALKNTFLDPRGRRRYPIWAHVTNTIKHLPTGELRIVAILADLGMPQAKFVSPNGRINFYDHGKASALIAKDCLERLGFSKEDSDRICHLVRRHEFRYSPKWTDDAVRKWVLKIGRANIKSYFTLIQAEMAAQPSAKRQKLVEDFRNRVSNILYLMDK
jgi:hypothetical protein